MFKRLGRIDGLNKVFEAFFNAVAKDERLSALYNITAEQPERLKILKCKYSYMMSCIMGGMSDWKGPSL